MTRSWLAQLQVELACTLLPGPWEVMLRSALKVSSHHVMVLQAQCRLMQHQHSCHVESHLLHNPCNNKLQAPLV